MANQTTTVQSDGASDRAHFVAESARFMLPLIGVVTLIAGLIMVLIAAPALANPFIMDEMEYPAVAQAIKETGMPVYYRGETAPANAGLWHPPLYILWLAGWQFFFGSSVESSRIFGLVNGTLCLVLIGLLVARRWRRENHPGALVLVLGGLLVAATSPLFVQGSILPDIDTQVLPLTIMTLFVLLFELRRAGVRLWIYWLCFVVAIAIQLFAKLTTPVLLIPAFVMFELTRALSGSISVRVGRRRHVSRVLLSIKTTAREVLTAMFAPVLAGIAGLLLLLGGWYLLAALWGVSFSLPFSYLTQSANNPINSAGGQSPLVAILNSAPAHFAYAVQWIGFPLLAFLLIMVLREFGAPRGSILSSAERVALYTFVGLLLLMYIVLRPAPFMFPKYYPPMIPPIALLAIDMLLALYQRTSLRYALALVIGVGAGYLVYVAARPLTAGRDFILAYYYEWPKSPLVFAWMLLPLAGGVGLALMAVLIRRGPIMLSLAAGALCVSLGWQITTTSLQAGADYSTTYHYGEESLGAVTEYLRGILPEDVMLVAPKDVGVRLQDRWRYIELTVDPRRGLAQPEVQYLVMRTNDYYGNTIRDTPEVAQVLEQEWTIVADVENFRILRRQDSEASAQP